MRRRGVRFQGDRWQARTKRGGKEQSLGLYASAERAAMAFDLDRLLQHGSSVQRLNFWRLRGAYAAVLADMEAARQRRPGGGQGGGGQGQGGATEEGGLAEYLAAAVERVVAAAALGVGGAEGQLGEQPPGSP